MKKLLFALLIISNVCWAQDTEHADDFLTPDFHAGRRQALRDKMPNSSVAVFFAGPVRTRSNDVHYKYHQDPNFYYLTGDQEPGSMLLIFKDMQEKEGAEAYNEIVFCQTHLNRNPVYDGEVMGVKGVQALGFNEVLDAKEFQNYDIDFSKFDHVLHFEFLNDVRDNPDNPADLYSLIEQFQGKLKLAANEEIVGEGELRMNVNTTVLPEYMTRLREVKTEEEIELLRRAVDISCIGQIEVMKAMHPEMSELEVQAIHEFVYKKYGAEYEGYPSIVGSGSNGLILHYVESSRPKIKGDLVLMDLGAEYHGYTGDITRTIPADGKFSKEEAAIYNLVYKAQEEAFRACRPGNPVYGVNKICRQVIGQGLARLGIIKSANEYHDYLPHGVTHHMGLDVHDPGFYKDYEAGMVVTIEPGIYIPEGSDCDEKWWGIAIRIEDDILITEDGYEMLSDRLPRKLKEVEKLMAEDNIFSNYQLPDLDSE